MSTAMNQAMTMPQIIAGWGKMAQEVLARTIPDEKKEELLLQAQLDKALAARKNARAVGAKMRALKDSETADKEPLEALEIREEKLVALGGKLLTQKKALLAANKTEADSDVSKITAQMGQVAAELASLREGQLGTMKATYQMLDESYRVALQTANTEETNYRTMKDNLPAIRAAIAAYRDAVATTDRVRKDAAGSAKAQSAFMSKLNTELRDVRATYRSDADVDRDLDAMKGVTVDDMLAEHDKKSVDAGILAEFEAATKK